MIATKSASQGKASVSVDGGAPVTIDLYRSATAYKQTVFSTTLPAGLHTAVITRAAAKNPASSGYTINLDAVTIAGTLSGFTRAQETDSRLFFSAPFLSASTTLASGGSYRYTNASAVSVTIPFAGQRLDWIAAKSTSMGKALVSVDGKPSHERGSRGRRHHVARETCGAPAPLRAACTP